MSTKVRHALAIPALIACVLTGACHPIERLDASAPEKLQRSLREMAATAPKDLQAATQLAVERFRMAYLNGGGAQAHLPDVSVVNGMTLKQFLHFDDAFLAPRNTAGPLPYSLADVPYLSSEYRRALDSARQILLDAQERAHDLQLFTSEQFEWGNLQILRPWGSADAGHDAVEFDIDFANNAGLDVYFPTFEITFFDPETKYMIGQQTLNWRDRHPLSSGAASNLKFFCCSSGDSGQRNQYVRSLAPDTIARVALTNLQDSSGRNVLDRRVFSEDSYYDLVHINACLEDLDRKADGWTPMNAAPDCQLVAAAAPPKEFVFGDARR